MGLKRYLRLFKTKDLMTSVRNHYFINLFLLFAYVILIAVSLVTDATGILSQALGFFGACAIIASIISERLFLRNIKLFIESDPLDLTYALDRAIAKYRSEFLGFMKGIQRSLKIPSIIGGILIAGGLVCLAVASFLFSSNPNDRLASRLSAIFVAAMVVAIIIIMLPTFFNGIKGSWFEQNMGKEIKLIDENRFKIMKIRSKSKYSLLEDKSTEKQITYSYKNEVLRAKAIMVHGYSKKLTQIGLFVLIALVITSMIVANLMPEKVGEIFFPLIIGVSLLAYFVTVVVFEFKKKNIESEQLKEYERAEDVQKEKMLLIMKKTHRRRWNVYFLIGLLGFFILPSLLAVIVSGIFRMGEEAGTIAYIVGVVIMAILVLIEFIFWTKSYGKMRVKMWPIEDEMDSVKKH